MQSRKSLISLNFETAFRRRSSAQTTPLPLAAGRWGGGMQRFSDGLRLGTAAAPSPD
jgi:hypothetical protein